MWSNRYYEKQKKKKTKTYIHRLSILFYIRKTSTCGDYYYDNIIKTP